MTKIIATFEVRKLLDDMHGEDINQILIDIAEENNLELISWGTI